MDNKLNNNNNILKIKIKENQIILKNLINDQSTIQNEINSLFNKKTDIILDIKKINSEYNIIKKNLEKKYQNDYELLKLDIEKLYDEKFKNFENEYKNSEMNFINKINKMKDRYNNKINDINNNNEKQIKKINEKHKNKLNRILKNQVIKSKNMINVGIQTMDTKPNVVETIDNQTQTIKKIMKSSFIQTIDNDFYVEKKLDKNISNNISENKKQIDKFENFKIGHSFQYMQLKFRAKKNNALDIKTNINTKFINLDGILRTSFNIKLFKNSNTYQEQNIISFNYSFGKRNINHNHLSISSDNGFKFNQNHNSNDIILTKTHFYIKIDIFNKKMYFTTSTRIKDDIIIDISDINDLDKIDGIFCSMSRLKILIN